MAKEQTDSRKWTMEELRSIVAAGMPITEARLLLDEGYQPAEVMELAVMQTEQRKQAAADTHTATAKAMQKAMRPENEAHPNVSSLHSKGGPFTELPFEFLYNSFPVHKFPETHHDRELELAARVTPGVYTVLRKDLAKMQVVVKAERDADDKITKQIVTFPISRADKDYIPPMQVVLYQIVTEGTPRQVFLKAMNEWLETTLGAEAEAVSA